MRIEPGTYIAAVTRMAVAALVLLAGCSGSHSQPRTPGAPLTVYLSVPLHGVEAASARATASGARLALEDAHARAGGRSVRIVELDDSKLPGQTWDPAVVEANARRAAADPTTIAYVGELDEGGSAVSVPVTNDANVLQVSPLDGLTTLTRDQPGGAAGTGPARYYPSGARSFVRLVPTDAMQAQELVRWARAAGAQRVTIVQDDQVFGRVLAQQVAVAAEHSDLPVTGILEPNDDPTTFPDFALKVAQQRPDTVIYTGLGAPTAGALLNGIDRAVPGVRLFGSSALAGAVPVPAGLPEVQVLSPLLPPRAYGPRARKLLSRVPERGAIGSEALYGYEAMRVVLDAIHDAGPMSGDPASVARAALAGGARTSVVGDYEVQPSGDVTTTRFGAYRRSATGLRYLGERMAHR